MKAATAFAGRIHRQTGAIVGISEESSYRKGSLEAALEKELQEMGGEDSRFEVIAFQLIREAEGGWSVNDSWRILNNGDRDEVLTMARNRWEVFKANYAPRATVKGLSFDGDEKTVTIESDCTSFLEIRLITEENPAVDY